MRKNTAIFTVCSANYLSKAIALALSAKTYEPECDFYVVISDAKRPIEVRCSWIKIVFASDMRVCDLLKRAFKYNIIEYNTSIKPALALGFLNKYSQVIYLDPDVLIFSALNTVFEGLEHFSILLTPHALSPYSGKGRPEDLDLLRFGSYNLGFFAVKRCEVSLRMLQWWDSQCINHCFYEPHVGMGVDQRWFDLVPSFFESVHIIRKVSVNVAFWNLHERQVKCSQNVWYVNDYIPLEFFHFSSFVESDENIVANKQTRYPSGSRDDFIKIAAVYREYLKRSKEAVQVASDDYSYNCFDNGMMISTALRRFYAVSTDLDLISAENPFASSSAVYDFAVKHRLLADSAPTVRYGDLKVQSAYRTEQRAIRIMFRLSLQILGPDKYFNLMRYLSHYSSLLNQNDLL
jgi:hypothetical protein